MNPRRMEVWQRGHRWFLSSHLLISAEWKMWKHGSRIIESPSLKLSRQMQHVSFVVGLLLQKPFFSLVGGPEAFASTSPFSSSSSSSSIFSSTDASFFGVLDGEVAAADFSDSDICFRGGSLSVGSELRLCYAFAVAAAADVAAAGSSDRDPMGSHNGGGQDSITFVIDSPAALRGKAKRAAREVIIRVVAVRRAPSWSPIRNPPDRCTAPVDVRISVKHNVCADFAVGLHAIYLLVYFIDAIHNGAACAFYLECSYHRLILERVVHGNCAKRTPTSW
eukprot:CAMPEP_0185256338 /NCGR_PEP_ID=MMETSP1359-20130426/5436_1 /TAXON_ID=552665 /ORGANISM="Bigelowiella longifila, Strain CCMP242" /LENGTH=277 /DNA_ID=CAMNT_0027840851 /DNA_START=165 /DNA_END=997 /DNA_ORIENTATION=-